MFTLPFNWYSSLIIWIICFLLRSFFSFFLLLKHSLEGLFESCYPSHTFLRTHHRHVLYIYTSILLVILLFYDGVWSCIVVIEALESFDHRRLSIDLFLIEFSICSCLWLGCWKLLLLLLGCASDGGRYFLNHLLLITSAAFDRFFRRILLSSCIGSSCWGNIVSKQH